MTERTVITTIEVTKVHKDIPDDVKLDKEATIEDIKWKVKKALEVDDVVVTNMQEFIRTESSSFEKAAEPLVEYLQTHYHPHCVVVVDQFHAELLEGREVAKYDTVD